MKETKMFNGKTFNFAYSALNKKNANKRAKQIRDSGHNARIVKRGKYYLVYKRK